MSAEARSNLSEFAATRDEAAFRRVVGEFGNLVLASARRRTDDPQLAEEIAQNVFAIMARKAERLSKHRTITGWVFTTTRLESAKALRGRQRHRRKLDALAAEINHSTDMSDEEFEVWRDALPHLDAGLDRLGESDRDALFARFFESKSFGQIASESGRSEAACRMRVHRSLEKLRGWMSRSGVTLSATAITSGLGAEWLQAAPAAAIETLSTNAVAAAPALGTGTILTNTLMTMNAAKSASLAAAVILLVGAVPLTIQHSKANRLEAEITQFQTQRAEPMADRPVLSALKKPAGPGVNPARRILREAELPDDPVALASVLLNAVEEQDLGALIRGMVSLDTMGQAGVDRLITQITQSEIHLGKKQAVRRMLIGFMDADETDGAALLEKAIDSDVQLIHALDKRFARWAQNDPAAAAEWIQQHLEDPRLDKTTGSDRIGPLIWDAIVPGIARTDPALAIAQLDILGPRAKSTIVSAVAGSIIGRGEEGDLGLAKSVLMRLEPDRRLSGISGASQQPMNGNQLDAFAQLARSLDLPEKQITGQLYWMATGQLDLPVRERADWVLNNLGAQDPAALRNFIWNTRQREAELGKWIEELPAGTFKDNALRGEISSLVNHFHDGGEAIARSRQISDDEMRAEALRFTLGKLPTAGDRAPAAANAREVSELAAAQNNATAPEKPRAATAR